VLALLAQVLGLLAGAALLGLGLAFGLGLGGLGAGLGGLADLRPAAAAEARQRALQNARAHVQGQGHDRAHSFHVRNLP